MENNLSNIKKRIIAYLNYKKLNKEKFFRELGMTSANFRGNAQKTPLNSTAVANILSVCDDMRVEWLLFGRGEMLKNNVLSEPEVTYKSKSAKKRTKNKDIDKYQKQISLLEEQVAFLKRENELLNDMVKLLKNK